MSQPSFTGPTESPAASAGPVRMHPHRSGTSQTPPPADPTPLGGGGALPRRRRFGMEAGFRGMVTASGLFVLVVIIAIGAFLIAKAIPALHADKANFFTYAYWTPDNINDPMFGIAAIAVGTLLTSFIAVILAVPVAICIALCLTHYAPSKLAAILGFAIDLLAAVPSIVYGLWGRDYLVNPIRSLSTWLHTYFGWIPIFGSDGPYGKSILLGSLVLAIMILPIVTALSRDVFIQTPPTNQEAALALGATKWEMIRVAVLPFSRPGLIAATMLGLGRALGETMALALTLGSTFNVSLDVLGNGGNTIAANIVHQFGESNTVGRGALIASGLLLFAITLVVNMAARAIIYRRREFREAGV